MSTSVKRSGPIKIQRSPIHQTLTISLSSLFTLFLTPALLSLLPPPPHGAPSPHDAVGGATAGGRGRGIRGRRARIHWRGASGGRAHPKATSRRGQTAAAIGAAAPAGQLRRISSRPDLAAAADRGLRQTAGCGGPRTAAWRGPRATANPTGGGDATQPRAVAAARHLDTS